MSFRTIPRTALTLHERRCIFARHSPSTIGSRTITGSPPNNPPAPSSSSSPSPSSSSPSSPPPKTLSDFTSSPSTPDRHNIIDAIRRRTSPSTSPSSRNPPSATLLTQAESEKLALNQAIERQQFRRWRPGDVYAPHDLSSVEMRKWSRRKGAQFDVCDALGLDMRREYKNYSIMWEYTTNMGRIKHSRETGLRPVNQRHMAKAVRRSIGMGLMPSVHKHPEMLETEAFAKAKHGYRLSWQR